MKFIVLFLSLTFTSYFSIAKESSTKSPTREPATSIRRPIATINGKAALSLFNLLKDNGGDYKSFIESTMVSVGDISCKTNLAGRAPTCTGTSPKDFSVSGVVAAKLIRALDKAGIDDGNDGTYDSAAVVCSSGYNMGAHKVFQSCEIYE